MTKSGGKHANAFVAKEDASAFAAGLVQTVLGQSIATTADSGLAALCSPAQRHR